MSFFVGLVGRLLGKPEPAPREDAQDKLETGGVTFSLGIVPPTPEQEAAWEKKREATARSRAGDTCGAVRALEDAQALEGEPQPHDEIRRAKYLQKDGRAAEAWAIYTRLLEQSASPWIDVDVLDAMRMHLQRDGQAERAIDLGIAHRVARVNLYRDMKREAEEALEGPIPDCLRALGDDAWASNLWERQRENHRFSVDLADKWISNLTDPTDLVSMVTKLAKKASAPERIPALVEAVTSAIVSGKSARDCLSA